MGMRLLLDTNVFIDAFENREPFSESAKLVLALGKIGEFDLWISSTQATDIFYILSNGGRKESLGWAKSVLHDLRSYVSACSFTEVDIDGALSSTWDDFEDACLNQVAHKLKPDAVITGNVKGFQLSDFPVFDCNALFNWLEDKHQVVYDTTGTR